MTETFMNSSMITYGGIFSDCHMGVNKMILNNDKHITFKLREFVIRAVEK